MSEKNFNLFVHTIFGVFIGGILATIGFCFADKELMESNDFKYELLQEYSMYYDATEMLLDDNGIMCDQGTDAEAFYLETKCKIDSLYNTQL